ncbi:MAG: hypothetical protein ACK5XQ_00235 [Flavobacteriales bacterium]
MIKFAFPLCILLSLTSLGQDGATLSMHFSPNTIYRQNTITKSSNKLYYYGSAEFLRTIKEQGIENPLLTKEVSTVEVIFSTGQVNETGRFPLEIEYVKADKADGQKLLPEGTIIFGTATSDELPTIDSISSGGISEEERQTMQEIIRSTFPQIDFPDKTMNVGDTFKQEIPISYPVGVATMSMVITSVYRLKSIKKKIAYFDIVQWYTVDASGSPFALSGSGSGKGKIKYNMEYNYPIEYRTALKIDMQMEYDSFNLKLNQESTFVQKVEIAKR